MSLQLLGNWPIFGENQYEKMRLAWREKQRSEREKEYMIDGMLIKSQSWFSSSKAQVTPGLGGLKNVLSLTKLVSVEFLSLAANSGTI